MSNHFKLRTYQRVMICGTSYYLSEDFLGKGYKDAGNGRFISADGTKVVRMGDNDILGKHGGGPHMNFETMAPNPAKPGKMQVIDNMHIYLED